MWDAWSVHHCQCVAADRERNLPRVSSLAAGGGQIRKTRAIEGNACEQERHARRKRLPFVPLNGLHQIWKNELSARRQIPGTFSFSAKTKNNFQNCNNLFACAFGSIITDFETSFHIPSSRATLVTLRSLCNYCASANTILVVNDWIGLFLQSKLSRRTQIEHAFQVQHLILLLFEILSSSFRVT